MILSHLYITKFMRNSLWLRFITCPLSKLMSVLRQREDRLNLVVYIYSSSTRENEVGLLWIQGHPGLHGEFCFSLGYKARLYLSLKTKQNPNQINIQPNKWTPKKGNRETKQWRQWDSGWGQLGSRGRARQRAKKVTGQMLENRVNQEQVKCVEIVSWWKSVNKPN